MGQYVDCIECGGGQYSCVYCECRELQEKVDDWKAAYGAPFGPQEPREVQVFQKAADHVAGQIAGLKIARLQTAWLSEKNRREQAEAELGETQDDLVMMMNERNAALAEVENLKFRLSMAESNNPDSVLSKHNAMLMACESRDAYAKAAIELQARLDAAESENDAMRDAIGRAEQRELAALAELDETTAKLTEANATIDRETTATVHWIHSAEQAESERDKARAEIKDYLANIARLEEENERWAGESLDNPTLREDNAALQSKLARVVALLEDTGMPMWARVDNAREALR